MVINTTAIDASTNIAEFIQEVNTVTGDLYAMFILASLFFFGLFALRQYGWDKAFTASSFITSLIGIMLVYLDMLSFDKVTYVIIMFIISLIFTMWNLRS